MASQNAIMHSFCITCIAWLWISNEVALSFLLGFLACFFFKATNFWMFGERKKISDVEGHRNRSDPKVLISISKVVYVDSILLHKFATTKKNKEIQFCFMLKTQPLKKSFLFMSLLFLCCQSLKLWRKNNGGIEISGVVGLWI